MEGPHRTSIEIAGLLQHDFAAVKFWSRGGRGWRMDCSAEVAYLSQRLVQLKGTGAQSQ